MSTTYDILISIKVRGQEVFGTPLISRLVCDETTGPMRYNKATGGGYVALPTGILDTIQLLLVSADQSVSLRLNGQSDASLDLAAGGVLLVVNGTLNDGAETNALVNNASGEVAQLTALAAGA